MSSLCILVADDQPLNLRLASSVLRRLGHSGVLVGDGQQALRALEQRQFDVVLMDVSMPVMDGLTALQSIREAERRGQSRTPVILVSGHDLPEDRERFLQAGADGFIAKPMELDAIRSELQRVLRH